MSILPDNAILAQALAYIRNGFPVFPLMPGKKRPDGALAPNGCNDATLDEATVRRWFKSGKNGIGISTNGLIVIDMDGDGWLANDPDKLMEVFGQGVVIVTPSGGRHAIYRQPKGKAWGNTKGKLDPKVDTRANGGLIAAPPTWLNAYEKGGRQIPAGRYYAVEGMELEHRDKLPEPPDWLTEMIDSHCKTFGANKPEWQPREFTAEEKAEILDSDILYANQYFHDTAYEVLLTDFGWQYCSCATEADGTKAIRLTRPGKSVRNGHSATWGSGHTKNGDWGNLRFYSFSSGEDSPFEEGKCYDAWDIFDKLEAVDPVKAQKIKAQVRDERLAAQPVADIPAAEATIEEDGTGYDLDDKVYDDVLKLLNPKGLIHSFCAHAEGNARREQKIFFLAGGIAAMCAILGGKVRTYDGQYPVLYILCAAASGMGKDVVKSMLKKLIEKAIDTVPRFTMAEHCEYANKMPEKNPYFVFDENDDYKYDDKGRLVLTPAGKRTFLRNLERRVVAPRALPHSGSGLIETLKTNRHALIVADELGQTIESAMRDPNSNLGSLLATLTDLFSSGGGAPTARSRVEDLKGKAGRDHDKKTRKKLNGSTAVLVGFTQPGKLGGIFNAENMISGTVPRLILLLGRPDKRKRIVSCNIDTTDIDAGLVSLASRWLRWGVGSDLYYPARQFPERIKYTEEADKLLCETDRAIDDQMLEAIRLQQPDSELFTRRIELIKRLSLIFAADRCGLPPAPGQTFLIGVDDVRAAILFVDRSFSRTQEQSGKLINTGPNAETADRVHEFLRDAFNSDRKKLGAGKERFYSMKEIRGKVRNKAMDRTQDRKNIMTSLVEDGRIECREVGKNPHDKRETVFHYRHRPPAEE